jgi:hypothetical protein
VGQGVGTFVGAGWTLTAYGCYRTGTRLFCDFDTIHQGNLQAGSNIWYNVNVVDDGGKITGRHNAFFVGDDGSQFDTAYITQKPVRFVMEYDDINQSYTTISLVQGGNRIDRVPIAVMDASQPAGTMPSRPAPGAQTAAAAQAANGTAQTGQAAADNAMDSATTAVSKAADQKKKASDFWNSLKGVASH